ncbi:MAG: YbjN domain-containing protein [Bacteroidales bacterium]|nr:YbjN domain-containing protein [Bacteroidales bacterium]
MNIDEYYQKVENVIKKLGVDPATTRNENKPGQWNLKKGSATVWVDVIRVKDKEYGYFQCMAPICRIPNDRKEEFYREALEINHKLYGVAFTIYKDDLFIKSIRELAGIDESEILFTFNRIGNYADEYDDFFQNKYLKDAGSPPA